jgi:hypothetical protein
MEVDSILLFRGDLLIIKESKFCTGCYFVYKKDPTDTSLCCYCPDYLPIYCSSTNRDDKIPVIFEKIESIL